VLFLENNGELVREVIVYVIWYQYGIHMVSIWYQDGMTTMQHSHSASLSIEELSNNKKEVNISRTLSAYEQETIISFNKAEDIAHIFTYEKRWQKHLEGKLGLKPLMDNGFGGKEYEIEKKKIRPPRAPVRLSAEARAKLSKRMKDMPQKRVLPSKITAATAKSDKKNKSRVETINQQLRTMKRRR